MAEQTPAEAEGRVAKQAGGCGYFAVVRVRMAPDANDGVVLDPAALDAYDRGSGWDAAAVFGATLGMVLSGNSGLCRVLRIRGMACDTSPALVAIAAVRAVWDATNFVSPAELAKAVDACILDGHRLSLGQLADLLQEKVRFK